MLKKKKSLHKLKKGRNIHQKARRKHTYMLLSERRQYEKPTYYDSNYMTIWTRKNYGESEKKISGCQRLGGGEINRGSTEDFQGS